MDWEKKSAGRMAHAQRRSCILLSSFLLVSLFALPSPDYAGIVRTPPKVISGAVQDITASHLEIDGVYYDISQAKIVANDGGKVRRDFIKRGETVDIVIEDGIVTKVRVDNRPKRLVR